MRPLISTPKVHFLWVGNPASRASGTLHGQDTLGPETFDGEHCQFWCLEACLPYYTEYFAGKGKTNITVTAIKPYLIATAGTDNETLQRFASAVLTLHDTLLAKGRNTTRDRVSFKVLFAYFLLYAQGGYVADSNVTFSDPSRLLNYTHFHFPAFYESSDDPGELTGFDIWLLYSPQFHDYAQRTLQRFIDSTIALEGTVIERGDDFRATPEYHEICGCNATSAVLLPEDIGGAQAWRAIEVNSLRTTVEVPKLGVTKEYFNMHKHTVTTDHLHVYLQVGNLKMLRYLLSHGNDVNQTHDLTDPPWVAMTLCHIAVLNRDIEGLKCLLEYKPDLTLEATLDLDCYTPPTLASFLNELFPDEPAYAECQHLLSEYSSSLTTVAGTAAGTSAVMTAENPHRLMPRPSTDEDAVPVYTAATVAVTRKSNLPA